MTTTHNVWWTSAEAEQAVVILNQLMELAEIGGIDQHVSPALGIAIDAIRVLGWAIDKGTRATSLELQDIVING